MFEPTLEDELKTFGHEGDPEEFRKLLVRTLIKEYPGCSDDNLLDSTSDAIEYCVTIQDILKNWQIDHDVILRTLVNTRKHRGLPKGTVKCTRSRPLARQLTESGCGLQVEEFEAALVQEFKHYADAFTTETLRYRPLVAHRYCDKVRILVRCGGLTDEMILRSLGNIRKRGDLPDLMSA